MAQEQGEDPRSAPRVPVKAQVKVQFGDLKEFVNAYSANISLTGMFVRTLQQCPAGTSLRFELKLSDDFALLKGLGQVVWVRQQDESEERLAGMGIRFLEIDQNSQVIISRLVDRHLHRGGELFVLEDD